MTEIIALALPSTIGVAVCASVLVSATRRGLSGDVFSFVPSRIGRAVFVHVLVGASVLVLATRRGLLGDVFPFVPSTIGRAVFVHVLVMLSVAAGRRGLMVFVAFALPSMIGLAVILSSAERRELSGMVVLIFPSTSGMAAFFFMTWDPLTFCFIDGCNNDER